jgi:hypothetical protein
MRQHRPGIVALAMFAAASVTATSGVHADSATNPQTKSPPAAGVGDLSPYEAIAADTLRIMDAGDLIAARKRITELETAWDQAEDTLKPRDPGKWKTVDKAIDRALAALRAGTPDPVACKKTLHDLIGMFDSTRTI